MQTKPANLSDMVEQAVVAVPGLGTKTDRAQRVEQAMRAGGTTVAVRVTDAEQAAQAEQILRRTNPREVSGFQESL